MTFIPNIKPILEAVPPILLGNMQSPTAALYVFVLYLAIQAIESYLITPLTACGLVLVKMLYVEDVLGDSTDIQSADDSNN